MIRVGLVGASGRSGSFVQQAIRQHTDLVLHAALVSARSSLLGQVVPMTDLSYVSDICALRGADVVVEFSNPQVSTEVARYCAENSIPVVLASTGHSPAQIEQVRVCAEKTPVCIAPNTSVGAAALTTLVEIATRSLGDGFDVELVDLHHRMKKDAPSGTALAVLDTLARESELIFGRQGQRRSGEIGVVSLRGGDVAGEHTVYFLGDGERIEISHRVSDRSVFGRGALLLARRLCGTSPGLYTAKQLLGV